MPVEPGLFFLTFPGELSLAIELSALFDLAEDLGECVFEPPSLPVSPTVSTAPVRPGGLDAEFQLVGGLCGPGGHALPGVLHAVDIKDLDGSLR
ncbi:hypothetical protein HS99_0024740 [Kitasatospora aureofaciens]|uniref:Uncharacterized protein n=1 Tax=Kitasatospora aureofaciens TaxID=1894 RepID=A0A1E7NAT6_KITAU|nr:hypothetical protein B6264_03255 [Kitasatospora aureofaciens]OEV37801.1 hypothetical protein HS99_0024740 [Kitasatospora aureofaciens]